MAYPPDTVAADKADGTRIDIGSDHANHHNELATAVNDIVDVLGTDPAGESADVGARFDTIDSALTLKADLVERGRPKSSGGTSYPIIPGVAPASQGVIALGANFNCYLPWLVQDSCTLTELWIEVTSPAGPGTVGALALYAADTDWQPTGAALVAPSTLAIDSTGIKKNTGLSVALTPGRYVAGYRGNGIPTFRTLRGAPPGFGGDADLGAAALISFIGVAETYAAWGTNPTKWTTVVGSATPFDQYVFAIITP